MAQRLIQQLFNNAFARFVCSRILPSSSHVPFQKCKLAGGLLQGARPASNKIPTLLRSNCQRHFAFATYGILGVELKDPFPCGIPFSRHLHDFSVRSKPHTIPLSASYAIWASTSWARSPNCSGVPPPTQCSALITMRRAPHSPRSSWVDPHGPEQTLARTQFQDMRVRHARPLDLLYSVALGICNAMRIA